MNFNPTLTPILASAALFLAVLAGIGPFTALWDGLVAVYMRNALPRLGLLNISRERFFIALRVWGLITAATVIVLGVFFFMPLLAAAVAVIMISAPQLWLASKIRTRRTMLRDQMVTACTGLANSVRAGLTLEQALESVADDTPQPLAGELKRINRERRANVPLTEAINAAKERINIDTFSIFAISLVTCLEQGGKVTEMLERISKNTSETQRLERKVQAETAAGRRVVWILAVFPLIFLSVMGLLHPSGTALMFTTWMGQGLLLLTMLLVSVTLFWSHKILSIDF